MTISCLDELPLTANPGQIGGHGFEHPELRHHKHPVSLINHIVAASGYLSPLTGMKYISWREGRNDI